MLPANYSSPYEYTWTDYTDAQIRTLNVVYYMAPPLSFLGSLVIIYVVQAGKLIKKHHKKPSLIRILLGFALMDVLHSAGYLALGPWALPQGVPWVSHASGSVVTCNVKACFLHLLQGLWIYAAGLSLYHVLKVRFEIRDDVISHRLEPAIHVLAWWIPIVSGSLLLFFDMFNPMPTVPGFCWIDELPPGCDRLEYDCVRGEQWRVANLINALLLSGVCFLIVTASLILIYLKVRATERRIARFGRIHRSSAARLEMTRRTGRHALWYIGAFFVSNIPMYVHWALPTGNSAENPNIVNYYFAVNIVMLLLLPLQGFLHVCIFLKENRFLFDEHAPCINARFLHYLTKEDALAFIQ